MLTQEWTATSGERILERLEQARVGFTIYLIPHGDLTTEEMKDWKQRALKSLNASQTIGVARAAWSFGPAGYYNVHKWSESDDRASTEVPTKEKAVEDWQSWFDVIRDVHQDSKWTAIQYRPIDI